MNDEILLLETHEIPLAEKLSQEVHQFLLKQNINIGQSMYILLINLTRLSKDFQIEGLPIDCFLKICNQFIEKNQHLFLYKGFK